MLVKKIITLTLSGLASINRRTTGLRENVSRDRGIEEPSLKILIIWVMTGLEITN